MRPLILTTLALVGLSQAATLYVLEGASAAGQYSSITAALSAASNGDTIAIKNRKGNLPWNENVLVSKNVVLTRVADADDWQLNGYLSIKNTPKAVIVDMAQVGGVADTVSGVDTLLFVNSIVNNVYVGTAAAYGSYVGVFSSNIGDVTFPANYTVDAVNSGFSQNLALMNGKVLGSKVAGNLIANNGGRADQFKVMGSDINGNLQLQSSVLTYVIRNNIINGSNGIYITNAANDNHIIAHNSVLNTITSNNGSYQIYHNYVRTISSTSAADVFYNTGSINFVSNFSTKGSIRLYNNENGCFEENIYYCDASSSDASVTSNWDWQCTNSTVSGRILNAQKWCSSPQKGSKVGYIYKLTNGQFGYHGLSQAIYIIDSINNDSKNEFSTLAPNLVSTARMTVNNLANLTQGNPDPIYNNVDGTRATIGIEGGPTPYSNWTRAGRLTPSATQARVYDLTLPASVKTGEVIPVTIKAYDH